MWVAFQCERRARPVFPDVFTRVFTTNTGVSSSHLRQYRHMVWISEPSPTHRYHQFWWPRASTDSTRAVPAWRLQATPRLLLKARLFKLVLATTNQRPNFVTPLSSIVESDDSATGQPKRSRGQLCTRRVTLKTRNSPPLIKSPSLKPQYRINILLALQNSLLSKGKMQSCQIVTITV